MVEKGFVELDGTTPATFSKIERELLLQQFVGHVCNVTQEMQRFVMLKA
jgi:hypothetical protein